MSLSSQTIQRTAEVVMFGALVFAAADLVMSRLDTGPLPPPPVASLTAAAGAASAPAAIDRALDSPEAVAPPVPPVPPPVVVKPRPVAVAAPVAPPARVALEAPPVLAGTLVGNGVYLAVLQSGTGTRVARQGDRVGSYIVSWIGPYKACVKDPQGQKHLLALGVGASNLASLAPPVPAGQAAPAVSRLAYTAPPPTALQPGKGFSAPPPPPPPPPPAPVR